MESGAKTQGEKKTSGKKTQFKRTPPLCHVIQSPTPKSCSECKNTPLLLLGLSLTPPAPTPALEIQEALAWRLGEVGGGSSALQKAPGFHSSQVCIPHPNPRLRLTLGLTLPSQEMRR